MTIFRKGKPIHPKRPELGDRAYEVEWADYLPLNPETGDAELDLVQYKRRIVRSIDSARKVARQVYPDSTRAFGVVMITPVEFTDPYGDNIYRTFRWEAIGDTEYYEGDDN